MQIERSDWAAPIVVVNKRDRSICICGIFKMSVNPVICPQVYPLPIPEEMFSSLANDESYSIQINISAKLRCTVLYIANIQQITWVSFGLMVYHEGIPK